MTNREPVWIDRELVKLSAVCNKLGSLGVSARNYKASLEALRAAREALQDCIDIAYGKSMFTAIEKSLAAAAQIDALGGGMTEKKEIPEATFCLRCGATETIMRKFGCLSIVDGVPWCDPAKLFAAMDAKKKEENADR